jgi:hypothetical protein
MKTFLRSIAFALVVVPLIVVSMLAGLVCLICGAIIAGLGYKHETRNFLNEVLS